MKSNTTVTRDELSRYAAEFVHTLAEGDVILLRGGLGAGKTTFVREVAEHLTVESVVSSPSFTIVNEHGITLHGARTTLRHVDLYRLHDEGDVEDIGLLELIAEAGVTFIEWPERAEALFTFPRKEVRITRVDDETREMAYAVLS